MAAACSNSCITAALHVWGRGNRTGMLDVLGSFRKGLELGTFVDKWNLEPKSYESNENTRCPHTYIITTEIWYKYVSTQSGALNWHAEKN
jgi:hypothetical protein